MYIASYGSSLASHKLSFGNFYRLYKIPGQDDSAWHDCKAGSAGFLPWRLAKCWYRSDKVMSPGPIVDFEVWWY